MPDKSTEESREIRGRRLGVVGLGNIGTQVSILAESLGMSVCFYDLADRLAVGNARRCETLTELLESAEIVTLHVDNRPGNWNLFGEAEFGAMRARSLFLNLSSGLVVDHAALHRHLVSGHIAGAAIDSVAVDQGEPGTALISELGGLPNVILTPHISGRTVDARRDAAEFVAEKLHRYLSAGNSSLSVNLPQATLPALSDSRRLVQIHKNEPGAVAAINGVLASHEINIEGQILVTRDEIGYLVTDIGDSLRSRDVLSELSVMDITIRLRAINSASSA